MTAENRLDVEFVARLAFTEKQAQNRYRPYIGVHKWFARRPGTLMRAILLAEFVDERLDQSFHRSHSLAGRVVGDPFMGGGTTLTEANRLGCDVVGNDINPLACWIVKEQIEQIDVAKYEAAAKELETHLRATVGHLYKTSCPCCKNDATVHYFHWVRSHTCVKCSRQFGLFTSTHLAQGRPKTRETIVCPKCLDVTTRAKSKGKKTCTSCRFSISDHALAAQNSCTCPFCLTEQTYPLNGQEPSESLLAAIEYTCDCCDGPRLFKRPDERDILKIAQAGEMLKAIPSKNLPGRVLSGGPETSRLLKYGFKTHRDLFSTRQLLGLATAGRWIVANTSGRIRRALLTNLGDLARYQSVLCRYDSTSRKCIDAFGMHSLSVKQMWCEANLVGVGAEPLSGRGTGSFANAVRKYVLAKLYSDSPFELSSSTSEIVREPSTEWIGLSKRGKLPRKAALACENSQNAKFAASSFDAILTDPPYHGAVQYSELIELSAGWIAAYDPSLRSALAKMYEADDADLSGSGLSLEHFESYSDGLTRAFSQFAKALRPGGLFAFTFHHSAVPGYAAVASAIIASGLRCKLCFPCPSEMAVSLHIGARNASRIDAVFLCRRDGDEPSKSWRPQVAASGRQFRAKLANAGFEMTAADSQCLDRALMACRLIALLEKFGPKSPEVRFPRVHKLLCSMVDHRRLAEAT